MQITKSEKMSARLAREILRELRGGETPVGALMLLEWLIDRVDHLESEVAIATRIAIMSPDARRAFLAGTERAPGVIG